jgi:hypothetical protein
LGTVREIFGHAVLKMLTKPLACNNIGEISGMNPGPPHHTNLELKATKAWAPQTLSFRGFLFSPTAKALGRGEAATDNKVFPKPIFVCNLHLVLNISKEYNATKLHKDSRDFRTAGYAVNNWTD